MASQMLSVRMISAEDLKNVRNPSQGKMKLSAVVSINGEPELTRKTPVSRNRGTSPIWNAEIRFSFPKKIVEGKDNKLIVMLQDHRRFRAPEYVGEVTLSLKDLFDNRHRDNGSNEYNVMKVDDDVKGHFGKLRMSYRFYEKEDLTSNATEEEGKKSSGFFKRALKALPMILTCGATACKCVQDCVQDPGLPS